MIQRISSEILIYKRGNKSETYRGSIVGGRQENSLRTVCSISQVLYNIGWSMHTEFRAGIHTRMDSPCFRAGTNTVNGWTVDYTTVCLVLHTKVL